MGGGPCGGDGGRGVNCKSGNQVGRANCVACRPRRIVGRDSTKRCRSSGRARRLDRVSREGIGECPGARARLGGHDGEGSGRAGGPWGVRGTRRGARGRWQGTKRGDGTDAGTYALLGGHSRPGSASGFRSRNWKASGSPGWGARAGRDMGCPITSLKRLHLHISVSSFSAPLLP